jgi:hypothetical protein
MEEIVRMRAYLENEIPGQVGRYDDAFNPSCVGDQCSMMGIPTILFEAGHYPGDYQRETTRELILKALLVLFGLLPSAPGKAAHYLDIPENDDRFRDIVIRNALLGEEGPTIDLALQYAEILDDDQRQVDFVPVIDEIGQLEALKGYIDIDAKGEELLINNQQLVAKDDKVLNVLVKSSKEPLF